MLDSVFIVPGSLGMKSRSMMHEMQVMNMGQYAHGNQPIQHMIYLYNYSSEPWKAQYWVREVMDKLYTPNPDAYCGDEDNGQTSTWYVFSAMRFYPVCPGSDQYVLGSPNAKEIVLTLENGKMFKISAPKMSDKNVYVQSVKINGLSYDKVYILHSDIMNGGELYFEMSAKPNKKRVFNEFQKPYSLSKLN